MDLRSRRLKPDGRACSEWLAEWRCQGKCLLVATGLVSFLFTVLHFFLGKVNLTSEKFLNFWNLSLNLIKNIICSHSHVHLLGFFFWCVLLLFVCFIDRVLSSCLGWHRSYHVTQVGPEGLKDPLAWPSPANVAIAGMCHCGSCLFCAQREFQFQLFSEFPSWVSMDS